MILLITYFVFILAVNIFFKKYKILVVINLVLITKICKRFATYQEVFIFSIFINNFLNFNLILIISVSLIFLLGLLSDLNYLNKPKLRLVLQFIILIFFVLSLKIEVFPTRIDFIDNNFQNTYLSYFSQYFVF